MNRLIKQFIYLFIGHLCYMWHLKKILQKSQCCIMHNNITYEQNICIYDNYYLFILSDNRLFHILHPSVCGAANILVFLLRQRFLCPFSLHGYWILPRFACV